MIIFNLIRYFLRKTSCHWLIVASLLAIIASCQSFEQPLSQIRFIENPATKGARFPRLTSLPDGAVLMSWVEVLKEGHALKYAVLKQGNWEQQGEVARGAGWFVNWADFPAVTAIDESFWVAYWLVQSAGGRAHEHDILVSITKDAGVTWSVPKTPYRNKSATGHGFVTIFPAEGEAGIVWLAERDDFNNHKSGNYSLRYTRLHRDGDVGEEQVIDGSTCTCCWIASATATTGAIVAWRSRREHEVRDHHIARLDQGKWTSPLPLSQEGWSIDGCPVNGPALAVSGDHIVASWFTAEGGRSRVRVAFSTNDQLKFNETFNVDDTEPSGRIKVEWLNDQTALVIWLTATDSITKMANVAARKIFTDGTMGPIKRLIDINPGRESGIPQLVKNESGFILAWTSTTPDYRVQTMQFPLGLLDQ